MKPMVCAQDTQVIQKGLMWVLQVGCRSCQTGKVVLVELGLWWDVTGQPSTVYLLLLLTSVFSFSLSPFYYAHPSPLCGLGINHSPISLLILFLLTSCYHFVVPFSPPFTRFEIAFWAKLQFISTSWQRYAELIAGRKWTSQQNQLEGR